MSEVRFTDQHEWVRLDGDEATVGITKFAAEQLGDVVFVEVPEAGRKLAANGEAAVVESVKAASEVYAPVAGEVTSGNAALAEDPAKVNADPEGEGWFFKMKIADKADLFANPRHPYTQALLAAVPVADPKKRNTIPLIEGDVPSPINPPSGCAFHTRCRYVMDRCRVEAPKLRETGTRHQAACFLNESVSQT